MKKLYNFRLETTLIKAIDKQTKNRTEFVNHALQQSLQPIYNVDLNYLQHLEGEVKYLRGIHESVMQRVTLLPEHNEKPIITIDNKPKHKIRFFSRLFH
jgi:hypothetical protein